MEKGSSRSIIPKSPTHIRANARLANIEVAAAAVQPTQFLARASGMPRTLVRVVSPAHVLAA